MLADRRTAEIERDAILPRLMIGLISKTCLAGPALDIGILMCHGEHLFKGIRGFTVDLLSAANFGLRYVRSERVNAQAVIRARADSLPKVVRLTRDRSTVTRSVLERNRLRLRRLVCGGGPAPLRMCTSGHKFDTRSDVPHCTLVHTAALVDVKRLVIRGGGGGGGRGDISLISPLVCDGDACTGGCVNSWEDIGGFLRVTGDANRRASYIVRRPWLFPAQGLLRDVI
ncbi:hypothetical protein WN48_08619 [Eufriesea mexicana]|uniref:Uncharacterized protein n=1 Tax=Eufriesea mexicana TaxID=516756 RepID=A0A310SBL8_9HYME|nr:hypothetical protein WN48_08619 [Eufriesea mexicana]